MSFLSLLPKTTRCFEFWVSWLGGGGVIKGWVLILMEGEGGEYCSKKKTKQCGGSFLCCNYDLTGTDLKCLPCAWPSLQKVFLLGRGSNGCNSEALCSCLWFVSDVIVNWLEVLLLDGVRQFLGRGNSRFSELSFRIWVLLVQSCGVHLLLFFFLSVLALKPGWNNSDVSQFGGRLCFVNSAEKLGFYQQLNWSLIDN